jgi:primase-polymerase (primpol)-like protein
MSRRPITATGAAASSTNPATWATYAAVRDAKAGHGVGFMLGEGIGCIDLDKCLTNGRLESWAQAIVDRCPATYIEVSPSGTGLHIFGYLTPAPGRGQRAGVRIEVYSRDRFMTVTGRRWNGAPSTLADITELTATL